MAGSLTARLCYLTDQHSRCKAALLDRLQREKASRLCRAEDDAYRVGSITWAFRDGTAPLVSSNWAFPASCVVNSWSLGM